MKKKIVKMLSLCFGEKDKTFCTGTREAEEARKVLLFLIKNNISFLDFKIYVEEYLKSEKVSNEKMNEELENINFLSNYLN